MDTLRGLTRSALLHLVGLLAMVIAILVGVHLVVTMIQHAGLPLEHGLVIPTPSHSPH